MITPLQYYQKRSSQFEIEANDILAKCEDSVTRVITISSSRERLNNLSSIGKVYLNEALSCIERGLYHAAIITAWVAYIDTLEGRISEDNLKKLHAIRPNWSKYSTLEELREAVTEYALVEAAHDMKLLSKTETKAIHGLLAKRNEVAHPSGYMPDLNESLGYISEIMKRIEKISTKV